jgi:hypothetical protein
MPKKRYTDAQLKEAVKTSRSYAQVLIKLGLKPAGGNYKTLQQYVTQLKISIAHFSGRGWNRGAEYRCPRPRRPLSSLLNISDTPLNTYKLKKRLLREGVKKEICEVCGLTEWQKKPIALHLDHINGNNRDNRIENLRIICPNCHAQTDTYCGNNWGKYRGT